MFHQLCLSFETNAIIHFCLDDDRFERSVWVCTEMSNNSKQYTRHDWIAITTFWLMQNVSTDLRGIDAKLRRLSRGMLVSATPFE